MYYYQIVFQKNKNESGVKLLTLKKIEKFAFRDKKILFCYLSRSVVLSGQFSPCGTSGNFWGHFLGVMCAGVVLGTLWGRG